MRSALFVTICTLVALSLFVFVQDAVCEPVYATEDARSQSVIYCARYIIAEWLIGFDSGASFGSFHQQLEHRRSSHH